MIILPNTHRIIEYFPFLNNSIDKSINILKMKFMKLLIL